MPRRMARSGHFWLIVSTPCLIFVLTVLVIPVGSSLSTSVLEPELGIGNYLRFFTTEGYARLAFQTVEIAAIATVVAFVLGYPAAYIMTYGRTRLLRRLVLFSLLASQLSSVLTRTFAWQVILGGEGPLGKVIGTSLLFTKTASIVGLTQVLLPFMALPLATVMSKINRNTTASSKTLGAGPAQTFGRVFVPMTISGIVMATVLVFTYSVGSFATPAILGGLKGSMLAVSIQKALNRAGDGPFAATLSVVLVVIVALILIIYRLMFAGRLSWLVTDKDGSKRVKERRSRSVDTRTGAESRPYAGRRTSVSNSILRAIDRSNISASPVPGRIFVLFLSIFLLAPQVVAIVVSFTGTRSLIFPPPSWSLQWYREFFTDAWIDPTVTSLVVALGASIIANIVGGAAAIAAARSTSPALRGAITAALLLPLLIPTVVIAAGLYIVFIRVGLNDSVLGIMLGHSVILLPFVFGIVYANTLTLNANLERASEGLGATKLRTLLRVMVPQLRNAFGLSLALAFLISFDEAVIGIFLSDLRVQTLPAKMYEAISFESNPTVGVIATLMTLSALLAFGIYELVRMIRNRSSKDVENA